MRVVKARAFEVWHGICLDPKNIVQNPVVEVLHDFADTENVMITTNHPKRAIVFKHSAILRQPFGREVVVDSEAIVFVPVIIDRRHFCIIWSPQVAFELQVIRRVGKD